MEYTETQKRILANGKRLFLEKGFKSAALRTIVKESGFTSGAFYGYYKTKEELFYALTDETAEGVFSIIMSINEEMNRLPKERRFLDMADCFIRRIPELVDFIMDHKDEVRLILKCAEGTKYENFLDGLRRINSDYVGESEKIESFDLLMRGYYHMLAIIVLEEENREKICRLMREVVLVYQKGILGFMKEA